MARVGSRVNGGHIFVDGIRVGVLLGSFRWVNEDFLVLEVEGEE